MLSWFRIAILALIGLLATTSAGAQDLGFSGRPDLLRFAVMGDSGTGGKQQLEIARRMEEIRQRFPFEFVLMLGDNMYGSESSPSDFEKKFERPYAPLLSAGVKFYASLGNHDEASQRYYPLFNMDGRRYYVISPRPDVRIISLDSTRMDAGQLYWLQAELDRPGPPWTLVFMHHPLYSSGQRHGPSLRLREALEPMFARSGVDAVFSGHEHFYERLKPQNGIQYFISGAAAKLRKGNIDVSGETACGFDRDNSFLVFELGPDSMQFAAIARDGTVVDRGTVGRDGRGGEAKADCLANRSAGGASSFSESFRAPSASN